MLALGEVHRFTIRPSSSLRQKSGRSSTSRKTLRVGSARPVSRKSGTIDRHCQWRATLRLRSRLASFSPFHLHLLAAGGGRCCAAEEFLPSCLREILVGLLALQPRPHHRHLLGY